MSVDDHTLKERPGRPGKKYVGVDLPTTDYLKIKAIADADRRKVGQMIQIMLADWILWYETRHGVPPKTAITFGSVGSGLQPPDEKDPKSRCAQNNPHGGGPCIYKPHHEGLHSNDEGDYWK
jgi:hypothetical protein